jgi:hypothetical protein
MRSYVRQKREMKTSKFHPHSFAQTKGRCPAVLCSKVISNGSNYRRHLLICKEYEKMKSSPLASPQSSPLASPQSSPLNLLASLASFQPSLTLHPLAADINLPSMGAPGQFLPPLQSLFCSIPPPLQSPVTNTRPPKPIEKLTERRKNQIVEEICANVKKRVNGDPGEILEKVKKRLGCQDPNPKISKTILGNFLTIKDFDQKSRVNLAARLTTGLTLKTSSRLSSIPMSTLLSARRRIARKPTFHKRSRELQIPIWFVEFARSFAPVRSGRINERILKFSKYKDFYDVYVTYAQENQKTIYSCPVIIKWLKLMKIKRFRFDRYRCAICFQHSDGYEEHRKLVEIQCAAYHAVKNNLGDDKLLITFDYSTFHESEELKMRNHSCLIRGQGKCWYVDCLSQAPHDWKFTFTAWDKTIEDVKPKINWNKIKIMYVFADGALKTKENIYYFNQLSRILQVPISVNYFAPYHGHSEVDGHYGVEKAKLKRLALDGPITSKDMIYQAVNSTPNTTLFPITVPSSIALTVHPFKGQIRKWFQWHLDPSQKEGVLCREQSGQGPWFKQNIDFVLRENIVKMKKKKC